MKGPGIRVFGKRGVKSSDNPIFIVNSSESIPEPSVWSDTCAALKSSFHMATSQLVAKQPKTVKNKTR